jgi:hypothetical protein
MELTFDKGAAMRIRYRISSGVVLVAVGLLIASALLPISALHPTVAKPAAEGGAVGWNPCLMWEQIAPTVRLAALALLGAFFVHLVQGLRNRPAPRWLGIAGLIALGLTVNQQFWQVMRCYTALDTLLFFVWVAAVGLMFLHHIAQRQVHT